MAEGEVETPLAGLIKGIVSLAVLGATFQGLAYAANVIGEKARDLVLWLDLADIAGGVFATECEKDPACWVTWLEIYLTEYALNKPIEEEEERREREALSDLVEKLKAMDIRFDCDYDDCFIEYKGFRWSIRELPDEVWVKEGE